MNNFVFQLRLEVGDEEELAVLRRRVLAEVEEAHGKVYFRKSQKNIAFSSWKTIIFHAIVIFIFISLGGPTAGRGRGGL